ncbi:MAG: trypsin-like peptidase domain-containing protein [Hyphomicrobiaceae bacterium]
MRYVALVFTIVSLAAGHAAHAKWGIIGKDDRRLVPKKFENLARSIGLLYDSRWRQRCTAFCVGDDVIATNAHCLPYVNIKKSRRTRSVRHFRYFLMDKGEIRYQARLQVNRVGDRDKPWMSVLSGRLARGASRNSATAWRREKHQDWALAKLSLPVCQGDVLRFADPAFLRRRSNLRKSKIFSIGFHGDKRDNKRRYAPCRISKVTGRGNRLSVNHTCDTYRGASGSPIFAETPAGPRVIALVVGQVRGRRWRQYPNGRRVTVARWQANVGVLPLEFLPKLERFQAAEFVGSPMPMKDLQERLIAAGYLGGRADGRFGPLTRGAIVKVEKELGLMPLGLPTKRIIEHLTAADAARPVSAAPRSH